VDGSVVEGGNANGTFSSDNPLLTSRTTDEAAERVWTFLQ
jgi:hypothetical protein